MKLYRWPQGRTIRWCAAGAGMAYLLFAALRWNGAYDGVKLVEGVRFLGASFDVTLGLIGAAVLALGGLFLVGYLFFAHPRISDFLIESEGELRKVTWPAVRPWFRGSTELWGATYVVIVVVVVLAVFTWLVDYWVLTHTVGQLFYGAKP